jgi:putative Holliday junction resolvase
VEDSPKTLPDPSKTRIVALDVGDRRIGVAITDELGYTAQPLFTLHRTKLRADIKSLGRLLRKHACTHVVVGNPLYMSGDLSPQATKAQEFAREFAAETGVTIHLWDERLTTTQAHRHLDDAGHSADRRDRKEIIDQVAAVLILQSFLQAQIQRTKDAGKPQV